MKKIILLLLFVVGSWQHVHAQNFYAGGIFYDVTSPTTVQVGLQGQGVYGAKIIPSQVTYNSTVYTVTNIRDYAFINSTQLTSITIPNTITNIGYRSFSNCNYVASFILPNSITSIGDEAFYACSSLTSFICNVATPLTINQNVFGGLNQGGCALKVPVGNVASYQAAPVWQNFSPITCVSPITNTATISSCGSYTWANTGQTYTSTGVYTGTTTNCITEELNLTVSDPSSNFSVGGINYVFTSPTTVAVGNNAGASGSIVIPSSVTTACGTYAVTSVSNYAFSSCTGLTSVTIPSSITSLGFEAFWNCSNLASITIPNSVTTIGGGAFFNCSSLTSITLSNALTSLSDGVFKGCSGLTSIVIPESVTSISGNAFHTCTNLTSVTIPTSLTSIGGSAFFQCTSLTTVTCNAVIPPTTTLTSFIYVNQSACSLIVPAGSVSAYQAAPVWQNFAPITCPNPPTSFSVGGINYVVTSPTTVAVGNNPGASGSIVIPASVTTECGTYAVTSIVPEAFFLLTGITSVSIPNSMTNIGEGAFNGCTGLTTVNIPNSVTTIGNYAFINCTGLISVSLPNAITSINDGAFFGCSALTSISLPNTITSIGYQAFTNCSSLTTLTIPNSVTSIGEKAFALCSSLTSITIPNLVTSIASQTFQQCTSLTSVSIPNSITNIGLQAFAYCSNLTSVTIPNSVNTINNLVFVYCSGLTSVTLPTSITSIPYGSFAFCSGLTSITIPNMVSSIGDFAFYDCSALTSVTCNIATPLSINSTVFQNVNQGACFLLVPAGSMAAYQAAPVWQNFLFPINSTVVSSQCGSTLATPYSTIACNTVAGATGYTFAITYNAVTYTVVSSDAEINLSEATGMPIDFNATYAVSVSVQYGAFTSNYGATCTVKTPIYQATQLSNVSCGQTLASIGSLIYANINWSASAYRFKVVNIGSGAIQYVENSHQWFALNWMESYDYYTAYSVSVELKIAGVWLGYYGSTCVVTSPAINVPGGSLQLNPSQCGATLPSIGTVISTTPQLSATGYRFRITDVTPNATGSNLVQIKDRSYHWFTLPSLSRYNYGSTYMIEVAVKTTGGYTGFGSPCYVNTPAVPTLVNCGVVVPTASSLVYTTSTNSVTQYRFKVTNVADQSTVTFDTNKFWFSFRTNVSGYIPNAAYSVRVAVMTAGTWSPYGEACVITSPAAAARVEEVGSSTFEAQAFPNPFTTEFKLNVTTSTQGAVELKVYDMLGKLIERRSINTIDYISEDFGSAYPAGVYNVIVSQGEQTKTLRLIKR